MLAYKTISIHALREEGDSPLLLQPPKHTHFYPRPPRGGRRPFLSVCAYTELISIHALREEGDGCELGRVPNLNLFLSTPSARRATSGALSGGMAALISIHALREEGDLQSITGMVRICDFYPRPPRGGRLRSAVSLLFW